MKELVLDMSLEQATTKFYGEELVLFEIREDKKIVKVMVPRGKSERYVVELRYEDAVERNRIVENLLEAGFFLQETRIVSEDW